MTAGVRQGRLRPRCATPQLARLASLSTTKSVYKCWRPTHHRPSPNDVTTAAAAMTATPSRSVGAGMAGRCESARHEQPSVRPLTCDGCRAALSTSPMIRCVSPTGGHHDGRCGRARRPHGAEMTQWLNNALSHPTRWAACQANYPTSARRRRGCCRRCGQTSPPRVLPVMSYPGRRRKPSSIDRWRGHASVE